MYFVTCLESTKGEKWYRSTLCLAEVCHAWMKQLRVDMKMTEACDLPNTATLNNTPGRRNTGKPGNRIRSSSLTRNRRLSSKLMMMLMMLTVVVVVVVLVVRRLSKFLLFFLALGKVFQPLDAVTYVYLSNVLPLLFVTINIAWYVLTRLRYVQATKTVHFPYNRKAW